MADDPSKALPSESPQQETQRSLEEGHIDQALTKLLALHPADQAELIGQLDPSLRAPLLPNIPQDALAQILDFLPDEQRHDMVDELEPALLGPLLDQVDRDVAADILHGLPQERAQATMANMATAAEVSPLLPHADESAGGLMTSNFIALHQEWTVDEALSHLRRTKPAAEQAFYLYVVDAEHRLEGVVSLRHLVVSAPEARIGDLMTPEVVSVRTTEDQEEVARQVQRYNFIALPVVDEGRRLAGVVNVDDLMDVAEEEATEDMYRMVGLTEDESLLRPVGRSLAPRLGWLLIALATVLAAAAVVNAFEGTIERVAVLAVFMPIIAGVGGNAGVQTITLVVRSLALGRVELRDVRHILQRELIIGMTSGIAIGIVLGLLAFAWKGNVTLAIVAGVAMLLSMTTAVTAGVVVPLGLRALRLDPALASGVLVTAVTDVLGFFFFLGLATLLVERIE